MLLTGALAGAGAEAAGAEAAGAEAASAEAAGAEAAGAEASGAEAAGAEAASAEAAFTDSTVISSAECGSAAGNGSAEAGASAPSLTLRLAESCRRAAMREASESVPFSPTFSVTSVMSVMITFSSAGTAAWTSETIIFCECAPTERRKMPPTPGAVDPLLFLFWPLFLYMYLLKFPQSIETAEPQGTAQRELSS